MARAGAPFVAGEERWPQLIEDVFRFAGARGYRFGDLRLDAYGIQQGEMEIMSALLLDERKYRELLEEALPVVIRTAKEYQRLLRAAAQLMEKPEPEITEEEGRLLEMLSMLIKEYEDRAHPLPETEPHKMLKHLLAEKQLTPGDLGSILPKSRVSEILNGKRGISKTQAKQLAKLLQVPVELFP